MREGFKGGKSGFQIIGLYMMSNRCRHTSEVDYNLGCGTIINMKKKKEERKKKISWQQIYAGK